MTLERTPFAGRLLQRLIPSQDHRALLGDLEEECQRGRSRAWYLIQILAAIVVGTWRDLRSHKLVAVRAAVIGLLSKFSFLLLVGALQSLLTGGGFMWGRQWIGLPWYWHWPYHPSLWWILEGLLISSDIVVGWVIVRLHREHGVTMVLAFSCVLLAIRLRNLFQIAFLLGPQPNVGALTYAMLSGQVFETVLLILGGSFATRRPEVA